MLPHGPFKSEWTAKPYFIVSFMKDNQIIYSIVPNEVPAIDGIYFQTLRDAKNWMKDNGFIISPKIVEKFS